MQYLSTLLAGSLVGFLAMGSEVINAQFTAPANSSPGGQTKYAPSQQMAHSIYPYHRGSGRRDLYETITPAEMWS